MQGLGVHAWNGDVQLLQAARCVTRRSMVIDRGMVGDASKSLVWVDRGNWNSDVGSEDLQGTTVWGLGARSVGGSAGDEPMIRGCLDWQGPEGPEYSRRDPVVGQM